MVSSSAPRSTSGIRSSIGTISGGWLLNITTTVPANLPPVISGLSNQTAPANRPLILPFTVTDDQTDPTNIVVRARDAATLAAAKEAVEAMLVRVKAAL